MNAVIPIIDQQKARNALGDRQIPVDGVRVLKFVNPKGEFLDLTEIAMSYSVAYLMQRPERITQSFTG